MDAGNTLNVLDLDGRVLHTRSLPNGVPLNFHLLAKELGAVLRIRTLQGAQPWTDAWCWVRSDHSLLKRTALTPLPSISCST